MCRFIGEQGEPSAVWTELRISAQAPYCYIYIRNKVQTSKASEYCYASFPDRLRDMEIWLRVNRLDLKNSYFIYVHEEKKKKHEE